MSWMRMESPCEELRALQWPRIRPHHKSVGPPYACGSTDFKGRVRGGGVAFVAGDEVLMSRLANEIPQTPFSSAVFDFHKTSLSRRSCETPSIQQPCPAHRQSHLQPRQHVDPRIGRARLDALNVAPVNVHQFGELLLRQTTHPAQADDILPKNDAAVRLQDRRMKRKGGDESGLIVAFWKNALAVPNRGGQNF